MKRRWYYPLFWVSIFILSFTSCDLFEEEEQIPLSENKYLTEYTLNRTITKLEIQAMFGVLATQYPETAGIDQMVQSGVWVYSVKYRTQFNGENRIASGLVCIPTDEGDYPLLSFQNGTNTEHAKAPSENSMDPLFSIIQSVSSTGFVVVFPDYLGFGASKDMFHPYLHKESTVRSVLDMLRAVKEMVAYFDNFTLTDDLYLMGYSQGGWATLALAEKIENTQEIKDEFFLKASSCGSGPYNLELVSDHILGLQEYPQPYFMAYMLNSYIQADEITLSYADILSDTYAGKVQNLFNGKNSSEKINTELTKSVSTLFRPDFLSGYATDTKYLSLRQAFVRNSIEAWQTSSPKLFIHGLGDQLVTPVVSDSIVAAFRTLTPVPGMITYQAIPLLSHEEAVLPWGVRSLQWIWGIRQKSQ